MQTSDGIIRNEAEPQFTNDSLIPDGTIGSATWVAGRWPQKRALMFESKDDHVKFELPGEFKELSMAVWVKLDRLENAYCAILNSDGWKPGALHWQLNRSGGPWMTGYNAQSVNIKDCLPTGQWVHLASTVSTITGKGKSFLNGRLVSEVTLQPETILQPGECRLGNWLELVPNPEVRTLSGRIDELMIWNRTITEQEVQALVDDGKPSQAWNTVFSASQN